jgi:hypothetical protein
MTIRNLPLTVGYRHDRPVGHITLDTEVEKTILKGAMFVLMPSIVRSEIKGDEIIELTLLALPASEGG